jgi:glycosyltransferase involved in cell wall biosynthesis
MNIGAPKIKLLFVITKLELGGAQRNVLDLAAGLDRTTFAITLFTNREGLLMGEALAIPGISVKRSRFLDRSINPLKDLLAFIEIFLFIRRNNIDIVHTHSSKAGIIGRCAAAFAGTRAICHTVHGWSFNDRQFPALRSLYALFEKCAGAVTRRLIVVSENDMARGLARGIGRRMDYSLIRYGIDRAKFFRRPSRERDHAVPVIGTVACLKPQKAPDDFVRCASFVCRDFPDAQFLIAGDGIVRTELTRLIHRLGLGRNVILCGWRRDIPGFLASLDIFCLTSLWEGLPIAVLEAMAASVPIVCTDTGGIKELINHGQNGFIVPRGAMEEMASVITGLLRDKQSREQVAAAGALLGDEFSTGYMIARTERLYLELFSINTA